jgi:hypothetical protein
MKQGVERKGRTLVEKKTRLTPGDWVHGSRSPEFRGVGPQADRGRLIDGLYKSLKIRRELIFDPFQKGNRQYFGSLFDDILFFLVIFVGKII